MRPTPVPTCHTRSSGPRLPALAPLSSARASSKRTPAHRPLTPRYSASNAALAAALGAAATAAAKPASRTSATPKVVRARACRAGLGCAGGADAGPSSRRRTASQACGWVRLGTNSLLGALGSGGCAYKGLRGHGTSSEPGEALLPTRAAARPATGPHACTPARQLVRWC